MKSVELFWFPRAGVGTDSGRASVPSLFSGSHAPVPDAPASCICGLAGRFAVTKRMRSHASAWERETLARQKRVPTPARGNEKR